MAGQARKAKHLDKGLNEVIFKFRSLQRNLRQLRVRSQLLKILHHLRKIQMIRNLLRRRPFLLRLQAAQIHQRRTLMRRVMKMKNLQPKRLQQIPRPLKRRAVVMIQTLMKRIAMRRKKHQIKRALL